MTNSFGDLSKRLGSAAILLGLVGAVAFGAEYVSVPVRSVAGLALLTFVLVWLSKEWSILLPTVGQPAYGSRLLTLSSVALFAILIVSKGQLGLVSTMLASATVATVAAGFVVWNLLRAQQFLNQNRFWATPASSQYLAMFGSIYLSVAAFHCFLIGELLGLRTFLILSGYVVIADTSAYLVGRRWGRHKITPHISPGKTLEGLGGAFVGVILAAVLIHQFEINDFHFSFGENLALAIVTAVGAIIGDLAISLLKRRAGVKDTAKLIPGHGGLLDRLDSQIMVFLACIPVLMLLVAYW